MKPYTTVKGHNLERDRVKFWKSIGHKDAATSRAESKSADDKGVDLCNIPVIEQCKNGYDKGINYKALILDIKARVKKTKYSSMHLVIIHKKRGSFSAVMTHQTFKYFMSHKDCNAFYDFFWLNQVEKNLDWVKIDIKAYNQLMTERYELH